MNIILDILEETEEKTKSPPEQLELPFRETPELQLVKIEETVPTIPLPIWLPDL